MDILDGLEYPLFPNALYLCLHIAGEFYSESGLAECGDRLARLTRNTSSTGSHSYCRNAIPSRVTQVGKGRGI